ncbi:MAG: fumarate hydratase C-terminal domain-containing protein, partial [Thermodesulfovibrionales bacterium]|nr:fumarate hydratase C-terminal domain-containing protein [Thermodesulfovibrionales bacterium]
MVNKPEARSQSPSATRRGEKPEVRIIQLPLTKKEAMTLKFGDVVLINGFIVTGRDKVHKFLFNGKNQKKDMPFNL